MSTVPAIHRLFDFNLGRFNIYSDICIDWWKWALLAYVDIDAEGKAVYITVLVFGFTVTWHGERE